MRFLEKFPSVLEKFPDSRNNFGFVPKQRLLELSPPVIFITNQEAAILFLNLQRNSSGQIWRQASAKMQTCNPIGPTNLLQSV